MLNFKKNKKIPTVVDDFLYEINDAITHNELPLYLSYDKESALTIKNTCEKYNIKMEVSHQLGNGDIYYKFTKE